MPNAQQELLDAARAGDQAALGALLSQFRPYIRILAQSAWSRCAQSRLDDSDLIQDALAEAHPAFASFRGTTVAEFAGWLRTLALRAIGHAIRTHVSAEKRTIGRETTSLEFDRVAGTSEVEPEAAAQRHERAARVAAALERLPADMLQVVRGRFYDGLAYADLALRMQRSEGALRVLYTRALRRMAADMQGEIP